MATKERGKRKEKREKRTQRYRVYRAAVVFCLFFYGLCVLQAQNLDTSRSIVVRTSEGLIIRQIITFPPLENILRYEIEIEERRQNSWVAVQKMETETNSFEVSLARGEYRYRYTVYNVMNLFEGRSDWQNFQLLPAVVPSPESYKPFYGMYYEMRSFENSLTVYGNDFSDKTEFALVKKRKNFDWSGISLSGRKDAIIPSSTEVSETQAVLNFSPDTLKSGTYQIFARNPGGLWVCFAEARVGFHSGNDFIFEYGYSPAFDEKSFFNSQYFRFGWFPIKTKIGNLGLGGQVFGGRKEKENNDMFISVNVLYQYAGNERFAHNARIGIMPFGDRYWVDDGSGNGTGYDVNETYLYINLGYSLQYFFWKNFYATAGVDFLYALTDHGRKSNFYINPFIGMGFQIGRWGDYAQVSEGLKRGEDYSVPVTRTPKGEHILSVGWLPMIPIYGIDFYGDRKVYGGEDPEAKVKGEKFLETFNPLGFNIRYSYLPHIIGNNKFGYEFEFSYLYYDNSALLNNGMPIDTLLFGVRYQRVLSDSWLLNARILAGIANTYNFKEDYNRDTYLLEIYGGDPGFALGAGGSIQFFFWENMFAEASADFMFVFGEKVNIQFRPGISLGWQFGRGSETGLRLP